MFPLSLLLLATPAGAWPADDGWTALTAGGVEMSDTPGDDVGVDATDLVDGPVLAWSADDLHVHWRLRVASDPTDGMGLADAVWGVLLETTGDDAFDLLLAAHGDTGELIGYANNGTPGIQPGFANYTLLGSFGDLSSGDLRGGSNWIDLRILRTDLDSALAVDDHTSLRMAAVSGPNLYVNWSDVANCPGPCVDLDQALSDAESIDGDGDGLTSTQERARGTSPDDGDSDDDGLDDGEEPDADTDGDGAPDALDCDADGDGLVDGTESGVDNPGVDTDPAGCFVPDADPSETTDPQTADTDGGGLADGAEDLNANGAVDLPWETDPLDPADDTDTDGDGIADVLELMGSDGEIDDADSDADGIDDAIEGLGDPDGDQLPNFLDDDADGDGFSDLVEGAVDSDDDGVSDFLDEDSDGDGLPDALESDGDRDGDGVPDRLDPDADGDGITDGVEGLDDPDGDGIPAFLDEDSDGDGIPDVDEGTDDPDDDQIGNWLDEDADGDGIPDQVEGVDDPDGDDLPNYLDTNSDDQGPGDANEGRGDEDCDGIEDYLDDDHEDHFCDDPQPDPEVDSDPERPSKGEDGLDNRGAFTGGACATTPASASWLLLLVSALALHARRLAPWLLLYPASSAAQAVDAQRFRPAVSADAFASIEDTAPRDAGTATIGLWIGHTEDPLVYRRNAGDEIAVLDHVTTSNLTGSYSLGIATVGFDLPAHLSAAGVGFDRQIHLGDLRLVSTGRVLGGDRWDLGPQVEVFLPTGSPSAYLGAAHTRVATSVVSSYRAGERFLTSLQLGARSGTGSELGSLRVTPALVWRTGLRYRAAEPLDIALELSGEDWLQNRGQSGAHPAEWLASVRARSAPRIAFLAGFGGGLTRGVGAPDFRVVGSVQRVMGRID